MALSLSQLMNIELTRQLVVALRMEIKLGQ